MNALARRALMKVVAGFCVGIGFAAFAATVENHGKDSWRRVTLTVDLFDAGNHFLDKCTGTEYGVLAAAASAHVRIECPSAPAFDHYMIAVTSAQFVPPH